MVRTKTKKQRGGHYGRGMKAGRGKGKRGGSGMSGLGKHRSVWVLKYDRDHFGVHGFTSHKLSNLEIPITLRELYESLDSLKERGFVKETGDNMVIDLKAAGYTKLLSTGEFKVKSTIIVPKATERCISKLSNMGVLVESDDNKDTEE
ncbi:MAG: 50S ribosomal protein L15 [Candidatus Thermoplasmatota archaeon]|jgi:large subunit ribosomal protein L15|nr:50S ribosomal protein L15 [Candidatus Thermoplasmatota archaeon]